MSTSNETSSPANKVIVSPMNPQLLEPTLHWWQGLLIMASLMALIVVVVIAALVMTKIRSKRLEKDAEYHYDVRKARKMKKLKMNVEQAPGGKSRIGDGKASSMSTQSGESED